jgi:hypothetical protein
MEELSEEFENFLKEKKVNVYAFGEGKPMNVVCICYKKCSFFLSNIFEIYMFDML